MSASIQKGVRNAKGRIVRQRECEVLSLQGEGYAEFEYQPGECEQPYRMVAIRKLIYRVLSYNPHLPLFFPLSTAPPTPSGPLTDLPMLNSSTKRTIAIRPFEG